MIRTPPSGLLILIKSWLDLVSFSPILRAERESLHAQRSHRGSSEAAGGRHRSAKISIGRYYLVFYWRKKDMPLRSRAGAVACCSCAGA